MIIRAPHPNAQNVMILPNPEFGDSLNPESKVVVKKALSGKLVTHVSRQTNKFIYRWDFNLVRLKGLELYEFIRLYAGEKWHIEWGSNTYIVYLKVNPLDISSLSRAVVCDSVEDLNITLEFETV